VAGATADSLRLETAVPAEVPARVPVPVTLRVENISGRTVELFLRGRVIAFDVVVRDESGAVVWRRLAREVIPAILRIETMAPGAVLELEAIWDQRSDAGQAVGPGAYRVHGELPGEGEPLVTPPVPLRIRPPS
jgi:hypothetical protein